MNISSVLDTIMHLAPAGAKVYAGAKQGQLQGEELKRKRELEDAEASRKEVESAARLDYLHSQAAALNAKTNAPPKTPKIKVGGREFDDTPEGQSAAIDWERRMHPQKPAREPAPHGPAFGSAEYLAATDAVERIREKHRRGEAGTTAPRPPRDPRAAELRAGLIHRYGHPASRVQQIVLDELAKGKTRDDIIGEMKAKGVRPDVINEAGDYLAPPQ